MASQSQPAASFFPLAGVARDGFTTDNEATATCFCGDVQMAFPTSGEGLVNTFVCHCADCRKVTASMFASNFTAKNSHIRYVRGEDKIKEWGQAATPATGNRMTNGWCDTCGTLMYRYSSAAPDVKYMRIGTVDDFSLHETKLRPQVELFIDSRVEWLRPIEGVQQVHGMGQ